MTLSKEATTKISVILMSIVGFHLIVNTSMTRYRQRSDSFISPPAVASNGEIKTDDIIIKKAANSKSEH